MSRRILWINPVGTAAYDEPIGAALRDEGQADTRIDVASLRGVSPNHLEYNAYEMVVAGPTMGAIRWGRHRGTTLQSSVASTTPSSAAPGRSPVAWQSQLRRRRAFTSHPPLVSE